jgi:hypothetical protein
MIARGIYPRASVIARLICEYVTTEQTQEMLEWAKEFIKVAEEHLK